MCDAPTEQKRCCCSLEPDPNAPAVALKQRPFRGLAQSFKELVEKPPKITVPKPEKIIPVSLIKPKNYKDPVSTGRKRAAVIYPLEDGEQCNWAGLKSCGGGIRPIVGCREDEERPATHIHHGPDKSTFNNNPDNLHHVCVWCHNRWHTWNDRYYGLRPKDNSTWVPNFNADLGEGESIKCLPHDPKTKATVEDFEKSREYWMSHRPIKAKGS